MSADSSVPESMQIPSFRARVVSRFLSAGGAAIIAVAVADTLYSQVVVVGVLTLVFTIGFGLGYNRFIS